jgi:phosphoglycolate phosphatase-like HAD superfamily hydrolase
MKNKKIIIFDFDGTIADTLDMGVEIYNSITDKYNCKPVRQEDIKKLQSKKLRELMKDFGVTNLKLPFLLLHIRKELSRRIDDINPIKNIQEALTKIKAAGFNLGILSSNSKENVSAFLKKNNLSDLFDFIFTGRNIFGKNKVMQRLLKNKNISRGDTIYIGDEVRDIEAAKKVGIPIVSVSWGFNSKNILAASHPDRIVDNPEQLLDNIRMIKSVRSVA